MFRVSTLRRFVLDGGNPGFPPEPSASRSLTNTISKFADDRRGNVAMPFAFMLTVMCLMTGAAVDLGMWMQARNDTEEAMDAAVLAGLKKFQDTNDSSQAIKAAQLSYAFNIKTRTPVVSDNVNFQMTNNNTSMQATGDAYIATSFLVLANVPTLPLVKTNGTEDSVAIAAVGTNAGQSLEVAIMIDNTGSMCESAATVNTGNCDTPSKIQTVISAANTLVDQVIWADQSTYTSKVSLIPFSEAVNLGTAAMATAARGPIRSTGGNLLPNTSTSPGYQGFQVGGITDDYNARAGKQVFWASSTCVTERTGTHKYDDTSPTTAPVGALYNEPVTFANQWNWNYNGRYSGSQASQLLYIAAGLPNATDWCPIAATLQPLTSNKAVLHNAINAMTANGGTAGHIGTAWAWYTLSPNFNSLWPSASNAAQPYSQMSVKNVHGQPVLRKIAILMTDGDYNYEYTNGVADFFPNSNPTNDSSLNQAKALCTNMKAQGIEVYTIGAMVSDNAQTFLTNCATDSSHFFNATDTVSLQAAFAAITQKLVQLHLSN